MVSIITCTMRPHAIKNVFSNYENQVYQDKELIIVLNNDEMNLEEWKKKANKYKNVSVYQLPSTVTQGECLNFAVKKSNYPYFAKFDDDDFYAPYYLSGSMRAFQLSGADIVGKRSIFCYLEASRVLAIRTPQYEHTFTNTVSGATLIIKKAVWNKINFEPLNYKSDTTFTAQATAQGYKIYSTDKYNFSCIRNADPEAHTWKLTDKDFLKKCEIVAQTKNFKPLVIKQP
ncbi:glycosyltransferase family 2 protein [Paenibacillus puldeungensis]|uniref:Glycosyltransferase family 2 protein n=1 Tax=Paenibacillus puldeungensis TaxID=696536 RepID=A0ABW3RTJ7_9BACL